MSDSRTKGSGVGPGDTELIAEEALPARTLERIIGKPPAYWASQDLIELAHSRRIRLVSLMHIGGDGWLKTLDFVPRHPPEPGEGSSVRNHLGRLRPPHTGAAAAHGHDA